jgi:hypothetical protein
MAASRPSSEEGLWDVWQEARAKRNEMMNKKAFLMVKWIFRFQLKQGEKIQKTTLFKSTESMNGKNITRFSDINPKPKISMTPTANSAKWK